jgi:ABC-type sulfate/molybdate transport systems ATPase subunit
MDEPFGALDFLTRLKMRADLVRIWQSEKKTILFVTHDIEEAVQLADRVLVMSNRPATIQEVVDVDLPRPRHLDSPGYLEKRDRIFSTIHRTGAFWSESRKLIDGLASGASWKEMSRSSGGCRLISRLSVIDHGDIFGVRFWLCT